MSIKILNVTISKLSKNDSEELSVSHRAESLENNAISESLVYEIHKAFHEKKVKALDYSVSIVR